MTSAQMFCSQCLHLDPEHRHMSGCGCSSRKTELDDLREFKRRVGTLLHPTIGGLDHATTGELIDRLSDVVAKAEGKS